MTKKKKKRKREGDRGPYLGSLTSGAPDLEGKNRKKGEKGEKKVIKKAREKKPKTLSQRLAAVCDRHPEANMDAESKPKKITEEGGLNK